MRYNIFNMKNQQKGSMGVVILVIIVVVLLGVIGYMYFKQPATVNQVSDNSQNRDVQNTVPTQNTNSVPVTTNSLTEKDILNAKYTISANFGGKKTAPQSVVLPYKDSTDRLYITEDGSVLINPTKPSGEVFWIYKYEFTDSDHTQATVYVGGNFGASAQDNRIFTVKKINGEVVTTEKI